MAQYRCYFLGTNGQLVGAETIECRSDDEAVASARTLLARKPYASGFELRLGDHCVSSHETIAS